MVIKPFSKKIKVFFLIFGFVFLSLFTKTILAQNLLKDRQDAIKEGSNQEAWLDEALINNMISTNKLMVGEIPDEVFNQETMPGTTTFIPGGAILATNNLIATLYSPPASGIEYLAQLKDSFLGKPVQAQGIGFRELSPLLGIWRVFRNLIYLVSAILFIFIGLMIIFRVKINPQTVVSIQNAIPKIITALILVTFSYAIAGLLIDLSNFIQALFVGILFTARNINFNNNLFEPTLSNKFWEGITGIKTFDLYSLTHVGFLKTFALVSAAIPQTAIAVLSALVGGVIGAIIGWPAGLPGVIGGVLAGTILIALIINIIILILLLKFFFGLIKVYITVILKIILAPLEIGFGALPNSRFGFSSWFIDLVGNLAVFPLSIIFLVLVNTIITDIRQAGTSTLWTPTLFGGINHIIPAILGLGALILLSRLPDLIPQAIFQLKPSPWGAAIGETLAPIGQFAKSVPTAATRGVAQTAFDQQQANLAGRRAGRRPITPKHKILDATGNTLGFLGFIKRK